MSPFQSISTWFRGELVKPRIKRTQNDFWACDGAGLTGFADNPRDAYRVWTFIAEQKRVRHHPLRDGWNVLTPNLSEA